MVVWLTKSILVISVSDKSEPNSVKDVLIIIVVGFTITTVQSDSMFFVLYDIYRNVLLKIMNEKEKS